VLLLALVPFVNGLHLRFLFNTSSGKLEESLSLNASGMRSLKRNVCRESSRSSAARLADGAAPCADGADDETEKAGLMRAAANAAVHEGAGAAEEAAPPSRAEAQSGRKRREHRELKGHKDREREHRSAYNSL